MVEGAAHEYKERAGTCADCGNSPVNHFEHYVSNTLAVWTAETLSKRRGLRYALTRAGGALFDRIEQGFLATIAAMPFAHLSREVEKAATYRSQVVWEEAARRGIVMEQLVLFGRGTEIYRARTGDGWFYFQSLPVPPEMRGESAGWLDDKHALKRFLASIGVATPESASVATVHQALDVFRAQKGPVVVKPRSGSRGRHTTVGVRTEEDLAAAFTSAQRLCRYVSIERYLEGPVCRATVVNGALAGFFKAEAPSVVGDGVASIGELINRKNAAKPDRVQGIVLTDEHRQFLLRQGLNEQSVPASGERVQLSHRTGRLFGGVTRELLGSEHPRLRAQLEHAARSLGIGIVGFDLIIPDPESDPDVQVWGIIEANTLPYIDLHYLALEGRPSNVAAHLWDMWASAMHTKGVDVAHGSATMQA